MFVEINSQRIPLGIAQLYLLGKQLNGIESYLNNFIKLDEGEDVEEKHCIIEVDHSEEVFVFDLFSSKGTLVNNTPLKALEKLRLKNGDILKVGKQEVKYIHDQQELSHDSSGFVEVNKNTSDVIASSPASTSQHERHIQRGNDTNFLVPPIPPKKSFTPNSSLLIPETETNTSRNSLNSSSNSLTSNNRRSDSFTIPDTQYCRLHSSLNASNLSVAESIPDDGGNKINFNFGNLDDFDNDDDDFCIPETQEVLPVGGIASNQTPRLLSDGQFKENSVLLKEEENKREDTNNMDGSQFRICTQDYNEGFGEEANHSENSQIIPLIKHHTINLNNISKPCNENSNNQSNIKEFETEMSALKWSDSKIDQETTRLRADCATPDILDFDGSQESMSTKSNTEEATKKSTIKPPPNLLVEDDEDLLPTQVFLPPATTKTTEKKSSIEPEKTCVEKENEEVLTLSDKENRCPVNLEPITDLPPTQLFDTNEARCSTSSFIRNSLASPAVENKNHMKSLLTIANDEEDDLLTQAFLQPTNPSSSSIHKTIPATFFNSTAFEDKFMTENPDTFFAVMEKPPLKETALPATNFKKPDKDFTVLRKTSSATSTNSETDLDLLMCTPQLIKEHIHMEKSEDLKKNILACKNKFLFGDDTDDEENEDDQGDLVKLINIPKDSLDFDKLLPHLNKIPQRSKISEEANAAKEAQKIHKFSVSFGKEQDEKERELAERKERTKTRDNTSKRKNHPKKAKQTETANAHLEDKQNSTNKKGKFNQEEKQKPAKSMEDEPKNSNKPEKTTRQRKIQASTDKNEKAKEARKEEPLKAMPARRMTRAKSRYEEAASTSKEAASSKISKSTQDEGDDLDSIATQPFVRVTRCRSTSKQSETQDSISSNSSLRKKAQHDKSKNDSSSSQNASVKGNITTKTTDKQRKRKAEATPAVVPAKMESKRYRSTYFQESSTTSNNSSASSPIYISMTMVDQELFKQLTLNSKNVWNIANNPAKSEVLVMDKAFRTFKFLLALARGIPIVTSEYLKQINTSSTAKTVRINDYLFTDAEFEKKHQFSLVKSLQMAKKHKLFKGYEFVMTAGILPNPQEIKVIIEASGGYVHAKTPPAPKENQKIYLISAKEDKKEWHKYRRLNKNIIIVSTEAIMSAVMRQTCEYMTSYTLS